MTAMCPLCEHGELQPTVVTESIRFNGTQLQVPGIEVSTCPACGEEVVLPEQARANERRFADAKRQALGLMTAAEITAWRDRHDLTQQVAAAIVGGGVNAFSKYERGEVIQSQAVDTLMRSVDYVPGMLAFMLARAGLKPTAVAYTIERNIVSLSGWRVAKTLRPANDSYSWDDDVELEIMDGAYG